MVKHNIRAYGEDNLMEIEQRRPCGNTPGYGAYIVLVTLTILSLTPSLVLAEQITLKRALEIAFEQSRSIRQAVNNLEISRQNLWAQQAALKSQFNLTLTPYRITEDRFFDETRGIYITLDEKSSSTQFSIDQPIKWTDGTLSLRNNFDWRDALNPLSEQNRTTSYRASTVLSFSQPVFTYNRTKLQLKELKLALENAQLNYALQKLQIERNVTQQFLDLYRTQQSLEIAAEELRNATESYEIIKGKVEAGISANEELFQAELAQSNSRATFENNQIDLENKMDIFTDLLDLSLDAKIEITADVRKHLVDVDQSRAIRHGLENRMELRQRDIDLQNAMFDLVRTGSQNEFRATIDFSYGLTSDKNKFSDLFESSDRQQTFAIRLNVPLFDWGQKKHRLEAGRLQIENRNISATQQERTIILEIRQSCRNLRNQRTQIGIAEQNVRNARLTHDINLERYRNGDLSSKDMSFYQTQLSREQLNEVTALINYQLVLLDLKIRTLYDFETNRPVIDDYTGESE